VTNDRVCGPRFLRSVTGQCCVLLLLVLALAGCNTTGPAAITNSREDYNIAIQRTTSEQLLLNLVRLRYNDTPLFLQISSVTAQLNAEVTASTATTLAPSVADSYALGLTGRINDNSTISYAPLQGKEFVQQILSPVNLESLVLLYYSGWDVDQVFRVAVQSVGDHNNAAIASETDAPDDRFVESIRIMRKLQREGRLELAMDAAPGRVKGTHIVFSIDGEAPPALFGVPLSPPARLRPDQARPMQMCVQLAPVWSDHVITTPSITAGPSTSLVTVTQIARSVTPAPSTQPDGATTVPYVGPTCEATSIRTRSIMAMCRYFSRYVAVPPTDQSTAAEPRSSDELAAAARGDRDNVNAPLAVHCAPEKPKLYYLAVQYRGSWFYISDDDRLSKTTFGLLGQLTSLQGGDIKSPGVLFTLPVSGR